MKALPLILFTGILGIAQAQTPAVVADAASPAQEAGLSEGEVRLRNGIVLLGTLCQYMAEINNKATAEAAVPKIMRLCEELQKWTQSFNNLPPLSEPEVILYEDRYLPTIKKINQMIEIQADRLAAAEYYDSLNLPAALVRIAQIGH